MFDSPFDAWHKSTRSDAGGCVEVSANTDRTLIGVRDTTHRTGGTLSFSIADWRGFIVEAKHGVFDR
ncbi:DUF397 domain-containing protein [Longispora albida]|uniref:DUF397 domain-containing protein n=1 Tax=Longispora albida TaxID=203523 RepID=UPI000376EBE2|nr:DUF397 domain-containing protein [Longispora albida]